MATIMVDRFDTSAALERRTQEIGRALFEQIGRGPAPWHRAWWDDRLMDLTLGDPEVKVQLFRFIDAMPVLTTTESVRRHLAEYLGEAGDRVPWWLRLALTPRAAGFAGGHGPGVAGTARRRRTWRTGSSPARRRPRRWRPSAGSAASGWRSRPTCWARPSSARPRPRSTSRPASTCSAGLPGPWPMSPRSPRSTATTTARSRGRTSRSS